MSISIVICCYNSSQRLPETLRHIAAQKVPADISWEVVLVDNASTDDTVEIAKREWQNSGNKCALQIVYESMRGINYARVTGIQASKYELVLFCDDDNWLSEDYVLRAAGIMNADEKIGVCGGRGVAVFEGEKPDWFQQYAGVFACSPQADSEGYLDWANVGLYSAGMVIRKNAVMPVFTSGYQSEFTSRNNDKLSGGEDFELVVLIRTLGYKAYYSDELTFRHYMPVSRMNRSYLHRLIRGATVNAAPAYVYADTLRWLYTHNNRYKPSWIKDIAKAIYGAFLIKVQNTKDLQVVWIKLSGAVSSVIRNLPNYPRYQQKIKRLYEMAHKGE